MNDREVSALENFAEAAEFRMETEKPVEVMQVAFAQGDIRPRVII